MEDQNQFVSAAKLLESAKSVIVILPGDPSADMVSAGLSLHFSLLSAGKKSQIGCGSEVHVSPGILGAGEIVDSIGAKNLIISFNYHEDDLEKVDYDVRPDGKFYLLIKPKAGAPVPDVSNVKYSYSGAVADLVITLGVNSLEELGKIYADEKAFLDQATILSLNLTPRPASFTEHLLHQSFNSFAEQITVLLDKAGFKPSPDAAKNLLTSIYSETKNLTSPRMTADTFSAISFLMKQGAKLPNQPAFATRFAPPAFFEPPLVPTLSDQSFEEESFSVGQEEIPLPLEENQPAAAELPIDRIGLPPLDTLPPDLVGQTIEPVPQDWTQPKIFRASDQ